MRNQSENQFQRLVKLRAQTRRELKINSDAYSRSLRITPSGATQQFAIRTAIRTPNNGKRKKITDGRTVEVQLTEGIQAQVLALNGRTISVRASDCEVHGAEKRLTKARTVSLKRQIEGTMEGSQSSPSERTTVSPKKQSESRETAPAQQSVPEQPVPERVTAKSSQMVAFGKPLVEWAGAKLGLALPQFFEEYKEKKQQEKFALSPVRPLPARNAKASKEKDPDIATVAGLAHKSAAKPGHSDRRYTVQRQALADSTIQTGLDRMKERPGFWVDSSL